MRNGLVYIISRGIDVERDAMEGFGDCFHGCNYFENDEGLYYNIFKKKLKKYEESNPRSHI